MYFSLCTTNPVVVGARCFRVALVRTSRIRRWRPGFGVGLLFGLGYFVPLLPWIGIYVGAVPWLALATLEAVLVGLGVATIAQVTRLPWAPVWAAALWVATEALTSRFPFGGFSWGKVAFSQADGRVLVAGRDRRQPAGVLRRGSHRVRPCGAGRGTDREAGQSRRTPQARAIRLGLGGQLLHGPCRCSQPCSRQPG